MTTQRSLIRVITIEPRPPCPVCGGVMLIKMPRPGQDFPVFWGCANFPTCKGTRDIDSDGKPMIDDDQLPRLSFATRGEPGADEDDFDEPF